MPSRPWGSLGLWLRDPMGLVGIISSPIMHCRASLFYHSLSIFCTYFIQVIVHTSVHHWEIGLSP